MTEQKDIIDHLKEKGVQEMIRFSIKARRTEENEAVHNAFKEFASLEADGHYTLALKMLLQTWDSEARYEDLLERVVSLEHLLAEKQAPQEEPKETF